MVTKNPLQQALKKFSSVLATTFFFSFCINLLMFIGPLYMLQVYDRVLSSRNETTLIFLTLIACTMLAVYGVLEFARSRLLVRSGMQFDDVLAGPLFQRVLKGTLQMPGANTSFALSDIDKLREFLTGNGLLALLDAPWVPIFLVVCFVFHPLLGIVATVGAVLIFILALANELTTNRVLREAGAASQAATHFATSTLQNVEVIRALGMGTPLQEKWQGKHSDMLVLQARASDRAGAIMSMSKFVRMGLQVFILGAGAYLVLENEVSPGIMIASSIMMGRALAPVEQAVAHWKQFVAARTSYARVKKLFEQVQADPSKTELPAPSGELAVDNLMSMIPGTRIAVLNGVTFALSPGDVLAVIGPSGAGKSSLVRHLVGVWNGVNGTVRLDGAELAHWDPERLAEHIGYLPQDVELFSGTIAENISRFQPDKDELVVEAATRAGVNEMILELPDGYDTQIGDGGRQLSGGQRQRVGLARAMFGSPRLVVLDEPNSNLDSEGETALMGAIQSLKEDNASVIFVSHKANLLALSDKTLVLNRGRVQAFGPTQQLLQPTNSQTTQSNVEPSGTSAALGAVGEPRQLKS